jgi:hypothetical protein
MRELQEDAETEESRDKAVDRIFPYPASVPENVES